MSWLTRLIPVRHYGPISYQRSGRPCLPPCSKKSDFVCFRNFRRFLSAFIVLTSLTCVALSLTLLNDMTHRPTAIVLALIEAGSMVRASMPIWHEPILKKRQMVASETIALFLLLPFQMILSLIVASVDLKDGTQMENVLIGLKGLIFTNTLIHITYTFCFILVAILTVCAFDRDVWYRDIDSIPSPFPMMVLFLFVLPCLRRQPPPDPILEDTEVVHSGTYCLPGCNCRAKPELASSPTISRTPEQPPQLGDLFRFGSNSSLSRSLVRIPDAIERRSSIIIAFDV